MPNRSITIQGLTFEVEDKYAAGHIVTENEANALNQTRAENLRNNFASEVKKVKEAAEKEEGRESTELTEEEVAKLREDFAEVAATYEFSQRGGGGPRLDPVQREAKRIAGEKLDAAIRAKYGSLSAISKEAYNQNLETLMQREDIQALAKANVEAAAALSADLAI